MEIILLSQNLLIWVLASSLLYTLYGIIYRLYLSPISSFPGPKLAALTLWYEFYYDIIHRGQYIWKIQELHRQYGPIIRINPYELHITDPAFYDVLYSNDKKADKWDWGTKPLGIDLSVLGTPDHDTHKMRRAALNNFFSMQRIRTLQPVVQERVDALAKRFEQYKDSRNIIQLDNAYAAFANDVVMEYSFSRHEHRIEAPDFDPSWYQLDYAGATTIPLFRHFNIIIKTVRSIPDNIVQHLGPTLRAIAILRKGMVKQIEATRNGRDDLHTSSYHSTIFHDILSSKLPENEKSTDRLADEAFLLVAAGTETTSWTLTVATFHLLTNPQILRRLKKELKGVDSEGKGHVSLAALQNLPYLTAILSEALRLTYGVAHRLQRVFHEPLTYAPSSLAPLKSKPPKEYVIPPGTPISMCTVDLHLNPTIFPDPHTFDPSRWLSNPSLSQYQMAFSKGTRRCVGMNLAYSELYTCLATIFVKYGSKDVRMDGDVGVLELVGTTEEDVRIWGDRFLPIQKPGSLGVRAVVRS